MNRWERHERILRLAGESGTFSLQRAEVETGASPATLRRDFEQLAQSGAVERVRGGIRVARNEGNLSFNMREVQHSKAKTAIARKAVSLLKAGDALFVDGGTTTYHICFCLPQIPLRIITNSLRLSAYLDDSKRRHPRWDVYLTGGYIQPGSSMLTGPGTVHSLNFYYADWAFLSVGGIVADGLYNTSEAVVETERKMIERSDRAIILADQSKIGRRSMCHVSSIDKIDRLIVNPPKGRSLVEEELCAAGCRVIHSQSI